MVVMVILFIRVVVIGLKKLLCNSGISVSMVVVVVSVIGWKWCMVVLMIVLKWLCFVVMFCLIWFIRIIELCMMMFSMVMVFSMVMKLKGWLNSSSVFIMLINLSGVVMIIIRVWLKFCNCIISNSSMVMIISGICVEIEDCVLVFFFMGLLMLMW